MKSMLTETRFEAADGQLRVSTVHQEAYQEYLSYKDTLRTLREEVDWLPAAEYDERVTHAKKHAYITGEVAAWLSQLDQQTTSANKMARKVAELTQQGRKDNWEMWA
jgi:uncharacterized coiled-coil DUF342 family protein